MHYFDKNSTLIYKSKDIRRYSSWVYFDGGLPHVYDEETPNCEEIWFEFYNTTRLYWKMFESECIDRLRGRNGVISLYNFIKLKRFAIRFLLANTNCPGVIIQRDKSGELTEESMNSVMKIHPRILRSIMDRVEVINPQLDEKENANLERQCAKFFGGGEAVTDPHEWLVTYSNLSAFWEKFGLNYYQILGLPVDLFNCLKRMMSLESQYRDMAMKRNTNTGVPRRSPPPKRGRRR